jgi:DNA polymerase-3 subunit beta
MKFLVERDALKEALHVVSARAKGNNIPILSHLLIEAEGQSIKITGHDLDSCSQATIPAEVTSGGAVAMPSDRFSRLIMGWPDGSQVVCDTDNVLARVRCGRSSYQFGLLPAADFPLVLTPKDPVTFSLTGKQVARLFKTPDACISQEVSRAYLCGIYLHRMNDRLAAVATDGHTLVRVFSDAQSPKFEGVIVPEKACAEFVRTAGAIDEAQIEVTKNLIAIQAAGRRYVSKLIDGTYPDYPRVIPDAAAPVIAVMREDIDAGLGRLLTARDPELTTVVKLSWRDDVESIDVVLRSKFGEGAEHIDCDCSGRDPGEVGMRLDDIQAVVSAIGGTRLRLFIDGPGDPIRVESPDDADIVGVIMPCHV